MIPSLGTILARRYRLDSVIGRGSVGVTYEAFDLLEGEAVALKLLSEDRPSEHGLDAVLRHEFRVLCGLVHPHLCRVRDLGAFRNDETDLERVGPRPYITADLIRGTELESFASDRSWDHVCPVICDVLDALDFLHRLRLIHGDIKAQNIVVDDDGRGVVIDLGCARLMGPAVAKPSGTPEYMAPELFQEGVPLDGRVDLHALGVTLARLASSKKLKMPPSVASLVERLRATERHRRPADAREVLEALGDARARSLAVTVHSPELIGRSAEVERCRALFQGCFEGRAGPRAVVLRGEPGSGRSRLLRELAWYAETRVRVVEGSIRARAAVQELLRRACDVELDGGGMSLVLAALSRLADRDDPCVLVLDDVHKLSDQQKRLWHGVLRTLHDRDSLFVLCAGDAHVELLGPAVEQIPLGPLDKEALSRWSGERMSKAQLDRVMVWSGGRPALIEAALRARSRGERLSAPIDEPPALGNLSFLTASERRVLAYLTVFEGVFDAPRRATFDIDEGAIRNLAALGWIVLEGAGARLSCLATVDVLSASLDASLVAEARNHVLDWLEGHEKGPEEEALLVRLRVRAGAIDDAQATFMAARKSQRAAVHSWAATAMLLTQVEPAVEVTTRIAQVLLNAGELQSALTVLEKLEPKGEPAFHVISGEAALIYGEIQLRLGRPEEVLHQLEPLLELSNDHEQGARAADLAARALIASGRYEQARTIAGDALEFDPSREVALRLREDRGLSAGYLGEIEEATADLLYTLEHHRGLNDVRAQLRVHSYLAILAYRKGDLVAAAEGYATARELAESADLDDQAASAWLNLGTVTQEQGDWGGALDAYERGLELAVALGNTGAEATLRFNVANLFSEIGLVERAEAAVEATSALLERAAQPHLSGPLVRLSGEIAALRSDVDSARAELSKAIEIFVESGAQREHVDCELLLTALELDHGSFTAAEQHLERASEHCEALDASDLSLRADLLRARLELAGGSTPRRPEKTLPRLEDAREGAVSSGQELLVADIDATLGEVYSHRGAKELARDRRRSARLRWERVATTLPETFREAFAQHPRRRKLLRDDDASLERPPTTSMDLAAFFRDRLQRFLAVNRKLNSSLSVDRVLEAAMDAAIELTNAERGFVLLGAESFHVASARNLDGERVGRSHLKFSRTIAEEVIRSEEPVLTVDAQTDGRFADQRSIHAMRLKSVACVPIRAPEGVLGALYLDNRFQRGRFDEDDLELLQAFADQLAIAVTNAQLHSKLEGRTRELEVAQRRNEELLSGQAAQIEALSAAVQAKQEVLEYRYDYSQIIGSSAAMQALFETLDRVIETPLTVLIQGESGTGKELFARAVHFNSSRRERPLVSLNCAAFPDNLIESELFGYERGAFTGADTRRLGLLASANGGTVFLDELGETSLSVQAKLLRVLQEREVWPLGASEPLPVDFRLVCATNRNLRADVASGRFREDLYYRITVVELSVPPLRERTEDLSALVAHLLERHGYEKELTPRSMKALISYPWPGNVRELENVLLRTAVMTEREQIDVDDLQLPVAPATGELPTDRTQFQRNEASRIHAALTATGWNVSRVSRELNIPRQTLYRKLRKYRIDRPDEA